MAATAEMRRPRGRPAKSLLEHVVARSFRALEHEALLPDKVELRSPALRAIVGRYRRSTRPETRRRISLEFQRAVRRGDG